MPRSRARTSGGASGGTPGLATTAAHGPPREVVPAMLRGDAVRAERGGRLRTAAPLPASLAYTRAPARASSRAAATPLRPSPTTATSPGPAASGARPG
jgi:hypothetical protein